MKKNTKIIIFIFFTVAVNFASGTQATSEKIFLIDETSKAAQISPEILSSHLKKYYKNFEKDFTLSREEQDQHTEVSLRVRLSNESFNNSLEKKIVKNIRWAFEQKNPELIKDLIKKNIKFSKASGLSNRKFSQIDGIFYAEVQNLEKASGSKAFFNELSAYLNQFTSIEYVDIKITGTVPANWSSYTEPTLLSSHRTVHSMVLMDVRGISKTGHRRADKFNALFGFEKKDSHYLMSEISYSKILSTRIEREPAFVRKTKNSGFDTGKTYARLEALRRGGYALAIEDFNNDGYLDAFVGNYGGSTLWMGSKDGTFSEVKVPAINSITLAKAAAFVDLDNNGRKDLFITRFSADSGVGDVILFKNVNGKFVQVKNAFPSNVLRDYAMPTAISDFNNDGLLDIYVGFPGSRDFSAGSGVVQHKAPHGLFINRGHFSFKDSTSNIQNAFSSRVLPHGALASDFDMDGKVDLMIMDDQVNLSPAYKNTGNGQFVVNNDHMQIMNYGYGMGIAAGDLNQDGLQDYVLSNATFNTQNRLDMFGQGSAEAPAILHRLATNQGMRLFLNTGNGRFTESKNSGLEDTGEAAGGVTVLDYDNDGLSDIYLVNGLWSGSSREETIDSLFAQATKLGIVNQDHFLDGRGDRSPAKARSVFMRMLMKERVGDKDHEKTMSFAGYQRNRLFKNLGNGKYLEVGYLEGVDTSSDGYMSVVADLNRNGKPDLVLRNCDPGAQDHPFPVLEVFENNYAKNQALWVSLKGTKSNSMGIGAKLFVQFGGKTLMREVIGNNSATQGEVAVQFGLGSNFKVDRLEIQWPSGVVNVYTNLDHGRYVFEEKEERLKDKSELTLAPKMREF